MRLVSDLSGRFKDLEVLREEKLTKTLRKMTNSLSLRQCHFSKQCNLLFSKYFGQIFSSPVNQIRDAFFFIWTLFRGENESRRIRIGTHLYLTCGLVGVARGRARASWCRAAGGASPPESSQKVESEEGRPEFAMCRWGEGEYSKKRVSCLGYTGLEKIRRYTLEIKYYFVHQNDTVWA